MISLTQNVPKRQIYGNRQRTSGCHHLGTGELPGGWKVSKTSMVMITQPHKFNKHHRIVDLNEFHGKVHFTKAILKHTHTTADKVVLPEGVGSNRDHLCLIPLST